MLWTDHSPSYIKYQFSYTEQCKEGFLLSYRILTESGRVDTICEMIIRHFNWVYMACVHVCVCLYSATFYIYWMGNYWFWYNWYYKYTYSNFSQNLTMWEEKTTLYFYHNLLIDIIMEIYKSRFILCWHPGVVDEVVEDNAPHQFLQVFPVACDVLASPLLVHGHPLSAHTSVSHAKRTPAKTKKRKGKQKSVISW